MTYLSLYRKWRPQTFEDVVGQDRVTRTLQNAIASGRIVHAYLFCGHRGTGKTTTARILAKALNCREGPTPTPCNHCPPCQSIGAGASLDVIEIDAASHRGIDEIRDLREKVKLSPVEGRYKVYIIDEAHMLTTEASNALLKTLEEPPAHVVLVLVTTEPHRLPTTITSRAQRFDFKRIPTPLIVQRLRTIAVQEGFHVEEEALGLIARSADGALRDAESLLDQLHAFSPGAIRTADVLAVLGVVEEETLGRLAAAIIEGNTDRCLQDVGRLLEEGRDVRQILRGLIDHFRDLLMVAVVSDPETVVDASEARLALLRSQSARLTPPAIVQRLRVLAGAEAEARASTQPRVVLELALLRASRPEVDPSVEGLTARVEALERVLAGGPAPSGQSPGGQQEAGAPSPREEKKRPRASRGEGGAAAPSPSPRGRGAESASGAREQAEEDPAPQGPREASGPAVTIEAIQAQWGRVMEGVKQRTRAVHAFLLESAPQELVGQELVLGVRHRFHMENLQDAKNRRVVEEVLARTLGVRLRLRCVLAASSPEPAPPPPEGADGGRRLVEEAVRRFGNPVQEVRRFQ